MPEYIDERWHIALLLNLLCWLADVSFAFSGRCHLGWMWIMATWGSRQTRADYQKRYQDMCELIDSTKE